MRGIEKMRVELTEANSIQAFHLGHHLLDIDIGGERAGVDLLAQVEVTAGDL